MSETMHVQAATPIAAETRPRGLWPLWGLAAGALGFFATQVSFTRLDEDVYPQGVEGVYRELGSSTLVGAGARAGFAATVCLLIFGAGLVRLLKRRGAGRTLALPVLQMSFPAAAGAMVIVWSLKAMLAGGMPGGVDEAFYTTTDVTVLHLLVDQMQWVPWMGLIFGVGALAVLCLKERVLPRWIGWVSVVTAALTTIMTLAFALPYSAGVVAPFWLVVVSIGLLRQARQP